MSANLFAGSLRTFLATCVSPSFCLRHIPPQYTSQRTVFTGLNRLISTTSRGIFRLKTSSASEVVSCGSAFMSTWRSPVHVSSRQIFSADNSGFVLQHRSPHWLMATCPRSLTFVHELKTAASRGFSESTPSSVAVVGCRRILKRFSSVNSAQKPAQKDISLLTAKRVTRRPKLKDVVPRDQVYYTVAAFATAEEYCLEDLARNVQNYGYNVIHMPEDAFDALHVEANQSSVTEPQRIFFFREGSVVFWNISETEQREWFSRLRVYEDGSYDDSLTLEEQETLEFTYTHNLSRLRSGEIELYQPAPDAADNTVQRLDMLAFSDALSLSVKLAVWEAKLAKYVESIEYVLEDLKDGKKIRMSEADVLRKAGELFTLSHLINLSSDLLDTPDFYWDRDQLEKLYSKTCNYLNIARRTRVMNEKLGQCVELVELLRDHLKDKHHTRLELMIIILITIEVGFAVFHLFERHYLGKSFDD